MTATQSADVSSPPQVRLRPKPATRQWLLIAVFIGVLLWSVRGTGLDPRTLLDGQQGVLLLGRGLAHPDLSPQFLAIVARAIVETIQISVVGLALASVLALPLAMLLAGNAKAPTVVREAARLLAALLRGVPDLLWAVLLVAALGPGPAAGALAIGIHGTGALAKLWAEQLEAVDARPVEALQLMGTGRFATMALVTFPQARAGLLSLLLFQAECNIRASTVLGFVGAGGIGQELAISLRLFRYEQLSTLILAVLILMLVVDTASRRWRRGAGATT